VVVVKNLNKVVRHAVVFAVVFGFGLLGVVVGPRAAYANETVGGGVTSLVDDEVLTELEDGFQPGITDDVPQDLAVLDSASESGVENAEVPNAEPDVTTAPNSIAEGSEDANGSASVPDVRHFPIYGYELDDNGKVTIDGITYQIHENTHTAEVTKIVGKGGEVNILDSITTNYQDYPVTAIGYRAAIYQKFSTITIPQSVQTIGEEAFLGVSAENINFRGVSRLATIGKYAFAYLAGVRNMNLPDLVTILPEGVFAGTKNLQDLNIGSTSKLAKIEKKAFIYSSALKNFHLPSRVTDIGEYAFASTGLESFTFAGNSDLMYIPRYAFAYDTNLTHFMIPRSVSSIDEAAFAASGLQDVEFQNGSILHTINDRAFAYVPMVSVTLPNSVLLIGPSAFAASGLQRVSLNQGLLLIQYEAFAYTNIAEVILPSSVAFLGVSAFAYAGVKNVYFQGIVPPQISNKAHKPAKGSFGVSDVRIVFQCSYGSGTVQGQYEGYDALVCAV
jgi:hypothetical protein